MAGANTNSLNDSVRANMALVRNHSIDRYLATLYLPQDARADIFALYGFDAEICNIANIVNEPMMGEIRLQWWRELIAGTRPGEAANHPIAMALLTAINRHNLPVEVFDNYLQARVFDLYNDAMPDLTTFEGYAGETTSVLFQLIANITGGNHMAGQTATAAGHAGVAWTIVKILKKLPVHRAQQRTFIPTEIMLQSGVSSEIYQAGEVNAAMTDLVNAMTNLANEHLKKFEQALAELPSNQKSAFLPMCLIGPYIEKLKSSAANTAAQPVDIAQWRKQIYLWRASRKGSFE